MATGPTATIQTATQINAWVGIIGMIAGSLISGGVLILSQWLTRRSDERGRRREIAINTAITYWQRDTELARFKAEKERGGIAIAPLDLYIIHMIKLCDLIDRKSLTDEDVAIELAKIKQSTQKAFDEAVENDHK